MPLVEQLEARRLFSVLTADFAALKPEAELTKAGLGSLFGATSVSGGTDKALLHATTLTLSVPMDRIGQLGNNPNGLVDTADLVRGTKAKLIVRYADMLYGFPYDWTDLATWNGQVTHATNLIKTSYKDVVRAVAPLNEPDWTMQGAFMTDPAVGGGTNYDARVRWLWTHTVNLIKSIDATIPLMGPNWVAYYPHKNGVDQPRMSAWLTNARNTNTLPQFMGWHQLYSGTAQDYGIALRNHYRPLEASLGIAPLPIINEEYGYNDGKYTGVPSALIQHWAEFEREGMAYAAAGVYDNGGTLGNYFANGYSDPVQAPNAGWHAANWYMGMKGREAPVSSPTTRYTNAYDGVATYDATTKTAKLLIGGPDDRATVRLKDLGDLIGRNFRVQLQAATWTTDVGEPNSTIEKGGDAVSVPTTILDQTFTTDANGTLDVRFSVENLNAYLMTVTPALPVTTYTPGAVTAYRAPAGNGALPTPTRGDAWVQQNLFDVTVPTTGWYDLAFRYTGATAATASLVLDGARFTPVSFAATATPATVVKRVYLRAGTTGLRFARTPTDLNVDRLTVAHSGANGPTVYEAEDALAAGTTAVAGSVGGPSGGLVLAGLDAANDAATFTVFAPTAGSYTLALGYGSTAGATFGLAINGVAQTAWTLAASRGATDGYAERIVTLRAGANKIALTRAAGGADLDQLSTVRGFDQPVRFEAEDAQLTNAVVVTSATLASGRKTVGGIDFANSRVAFDVRVPTAGLYDLAVRYTAGLGAATHLVSVDNVAQGAVSYAATDSWGATDLRVATKLVALKAGVNTIAFTKGAGFAELDFVQVTPDTHRYEAETAARTGANGGHFPFAYTHPYHNHVAQIDTATSAVTFNVDAPVAGNYVVSINHANPGAATHNVTLNGVAAGAVSYPATAGWFGTVGPATGGRTTTLTLALTAGINAIKLSKGNGFAELNWLNIAYTATAAPAPLTTALARFADGDPIRVRDRVVDDVL